MSGVCRGRGIRKKQTIVLISCGLKCGGEWAGGYKLEKLQTSNVAHGPGHFDFGSNHTRSILGPRGPTTTNPSVATNANYANRWESIINQTRSLLEHTHTSHVEFSHLSQKPAGDYITRKRHHRRNRSIFQFYKKVTMETNQYVNKMSNCVADRRAI